MGQPLSYRPLLFFHDLISGRAVLFHFMCDLQPVFPVFFIVGCKVAGIKNVQQKMNGHICREVSYLGVQPFPGGDVEGIIRQRADRIVSQSGEKDNGDPLSWRTLASSWIRTGEPE